MWQLRQAFFREEETEKFLKNLEGSRKEDSVDEETYNQLKEQYQQFLEENRAEIERIKTQLVTNLGKAEEMLQQLQKALRILETRARVGELKERDYQSQSRRVMLTIEATQRRIAELKHLIGSNSSAEVRGYVEAKIEPVKGISLPKIELPAIKFAGISPLENITPLRIAGFVVSLLMLIFVFLSWVSVEYLGLEFGFKALETVSEQEDKIREFNFGGIFALLAGILGIVVSLVANRSSSRGLGYLGTGILGLAGIIIFSVIFANSYQNAVEQVEEAEYWGEASLSFSPEAGGILYLIATLAILVVGYLELRQEKR
jgi:ribosomal protein S6